ncbi:hypothetical protein ACWEQL_27670 [Kitasatospora sp. NPDC004240]
MGILHHREDLAGKSSDGNSGDAKSSPGDKFIFLRHRSAWRAHAFARIDYLRSQLEFEKCRDQDCPEVALINGANGLLSEAERALRSIWPWSSASGWATERAWANIHAAEVTLMQLADDSSIASRGLHLSALLPYVEPENGQRRRVAKLCRRIMSGENLSPQDRQVMLSSLREAYRNRDKEFARMRNIRNALFISTVLTSLMLAALTIILYLELIPALNLCFTGPDGDICASSHNFSTHSAATDVLLIEISGVLGAAITAIASLHSIRPTSAPYRIQLASATLKIPAGALSALVGIMLIRGEFVPGLTDLDTPPQILAWAVTFGAAQHLVTRIVDARARETLPASEREERRHLNRRERG